MQTFKIFYNDGNQKYKGAPSLKVLMFYLSKYDDRIEDIEKIERVPEEKAKKLNTVPSLNKGVKK